MPAEADGPDFFRVTGVRPESGLIMRAAPGQEAARVGRIPGLADGLRNLGCRGGPSLTEWQAMTEAERFAARRMRWCRISYGGVTGWVAGWYLAEGRVPVPQ